MYKNRMRINTQLWEDRKLSTVITLVFDVFSTAVTLISVWLKLNMTSTYRFLSPFRMGILITICPIFETTAFGL